LNAAEPDRNAWARFERGEITLSEFDQAFEAESRAAGFAIPGCEVVALLYGAPRPAMVAALRRCGEHYITACLTNNVKTGTGNGLPATDERARQVREILGLFDRVFESSIMGVRKPEPRFYRMALDTLQVAPEAAVYLDDLGINLKPARAMGMTTIRCRALTRPWPSCRPSSISRSSTSEPMRGCLEVEARARITREMSSRDLSSQDAERRYSPRRGLRGARANSRS
jgi:putative hydrolase of the HAD superfamily